MSDQERPQVGIISDCPLQRGTLQKVLSGYGLNVAVVCDPQVLDHQPEERVKLVQCWVVALEDESVDYDALDALIEHGEQPILFGVGKAPLAHDQLFISWERRLLSKIEEHLGRVEMTDSEEAIIALDSSVMDSVERHEVNRHRSEIESNQIWILAASLGGPAAVKEFLDEMPSTIRAGFLYAQHIDPHFSKVLTNVLGRHAELQLKPIEPADQIFDGDVLVVPVDHEITFSDQGIRIEACDWNGPYGPSIDHLLKNAFSYFGNRCHVIVFSGMGNDGALSVPRMHEAGCQVWTQTVESCANGSMPESIMELKCSTRSGTPKELARAFIDFVGCHPGSDENTHDYI